MFSKASTAGNHGEPNPNPNERKRRKTRPAGRPGMHTLQNSLVVALQPEDLLATGRYICEVCGKGFQRDQNLQLHMRTHNINWELKKSGGTPARRKAYICPVPTCVYNDRSRALSDITGIKKHFNRKHGTKNLICPQCSKPYAVEADLKAHLKNHILRDHQCECGSTFSRKNSYEAHRAFCCKLLEESMKLPSSVAGEPSTRADVDVFGGNFELPDMNEQLVYTNIGFTSPQEAPLRVEATAEQPNAVLNDDRDAPSAGQLNRSVAMLPDDPDFVASLPVCLTRLLKSRYDEVLCMYSSSGTYGGMAQVASPPLAANHSFSNASLDELREENGLNGKSSTFDFFGGSSSSFMDHGAPSTEESQGLGPHLSLSNVCAYGKREQKSVAANSTVYNDFLSLSESLTLSASFFDAGKESYYAGIDEPMLASLVCMNSIHQPHLASTFTESSATALLQKAGVMNATMSMPASTCFPGQAMSTESILNMEQFQIQQEKNFPPGDSSTSHFLTLTPNHQTDPRKSSIHSYQQQENWISDPSRSAFQLYQHDRSTASNKPASSSFFCDAVKSMDSYSKLKDSQWSRQEKAPTDFTDFFTSSTGKKPTEEDGGAGNAVLGFPAAEPIMSPYALPSETAPENRGTETGWNRRLEAVAPPPSSSMNQNGDGVTMDLLGMGGEGAEAGGYSEDQMGFFFGNGGCFW
ncbi:unnamed protein product [Musa hybrid cultivar]